MRLLPGPLVGVIDSFLVMINNLASLKFLGIGEESLFEVRHW
jgi:hypothetical protein